MGFFKNMGRPSGCIECDDNQCCVPTCPTQLWVSISGVTVCECVEGSSDPCFDPELNNPNGVWLVSYTAGGYWEGDPCFYGGAAGPCALTVMYYPDSQYVSYALATGVDGYFTFNGGGFLNTPFGNVTACWGGSAADGGTGIVYLVDDDDDDDDD